MSTLTPGHATAGERFEDPPRRRRDLRARVGRADALNTAELPVVPSLSLPRSRPIPTLEVDPDGGARPPASVLPMQRSAVTATSADPIPVGRPIRWDEEHGEVATTPNLPTASGGVTGTAAPAGVSAAILRNVPTQSAAVAAESIPSPGRSVRRAAPWTPVNLGPTSVPTHTRFFAPMAIAPGEPSPSAEPSAVAPAPLPGWGGVPAFPIPGAPRGRQHHGRSALTVVLGSALALAAAAASLQYFELVDLLGLVGW